MSKRNLLNLILFAFIIVLAAFVFFEPGKDIAKIPPTLTRLKAKDVTHIKISRNATTAVENDMEFEKTAAGWIMLKPYQYTANTFRINSILELLSTASFSQNDLNTLNKSTFGLDKPRATITFNNDTAIIFGHNKSLKNHRYIQIGSTLHLVADTFFYQLSAKAESYLSHKLLPEKSKITKLTLPDITVMKENGKWKLTPEANNITSDSINQLISEWQLSQAYDINKIKPEPKGKPDIIIQLDNNKQLNFKIEKIKSSFNLINLQFGIRYILSADRKNKLLKLSSINQDS